MDASRNPYLFRPAGSEPSPYRAYPGPTGAQRSDNEAPPAYPQSPTRPPPRVPSMPTGRQSDSHHPPPRPPPPPFPPTREPPRHDTPVEPDRGARREPEPRAPHPMPSRAPPPVPLPNLSGFSNDRRQTVSSDRAPLSMNGIERALPTDTQTLPDTDSTVSEGPATPAGVSDRKGEVEERFKKGLEVIAFIKEKGNYNEDASQIILRLQMAADRAVKRSYVSGTPVREYYEDAPVIKVGIVFLPGVDRPTVTQLEQEMLMANYKPDQLSAAWRVNTAGHLLNDFEVTKDLRVIAKDLTPNVLENLRRREEGRSSFVPGHMTDALALRHESKQEGLPTVNIESDQVKIVDDLRHYTGQFDLESTLVEVDYSSMVSLLVNFQLIIQNRNAAKDLDETRNLLEAMMEDVRRLCNRSSILFRMSTRVKIITSKDIRYGVNNGREFTTLTTSKGIANIINKSSSYYTSLHEVEQIQQLLKPRFLQMLVLLLSFLNDDDLKNIQEFLERTFHFNADRKNLELLLLKVIPFYSINSHVFLTSLVPAFEGFSPRKPDKQDHSYYWETFVSRIAAQGYILPGTPHQLCRAQKSWIMQWPEKGFLDSLPFRNLQYSANDDMSTFNEIPPIERDYDRHNDNTLLTAIFMDNRHYMIRIVDYEAIICLTKGVYSVQEADVEDQRFEGQRFDLVIEENQLNQATYTAVDQINVVIRSVNDWVATTMNPARGRRASGVFGRVRRGRAPDVEMIEELRVTGRLTRFRAILGNSLLAIAYKLDGRKITLEDAIANLARDNQVIQSVVEYYQDRIQRYGHNFPPETLRRITHSLNAVATQIGTTEGVRQRISNDPTISDEPIVRLVEQSAGSYYTAPVWNKYRVSVTTGNMLSLEAKKSYVTDIRWEGQEIAISLQNDNNMYVVTTLDYPDPKERDDQVVLGDVAVLAGQYMIVAVPVEDDGSDALRMSNYLRIVRVEQQGAKMSIRQRRMQQSEGLGMSRSVYV